jgi:hypothetical protein
VQITVGVRSSTGRGPVTLSAWHLDSGELKAEHHTASDQVESLEAFLPVTGAGIGGKAFYWDALCVGRCSEGLGAL